MRTPYLSTRQSLILSGAILLASSAAPIGCGCVIPSAASTDEAPGPEISASDDLQPTSGDRCGFRPG